MYPTLNVLRSYNLKFDLNGMGPGIDFPLIMNYRAEEQQSSRAEDYFYFLNGHNDVVYFADYNFTKDLIETYEYLCMGKLG